MSPLVKQNLAKLDKDGKICRIAMDFLNHYVEDLELAFMPRFNMQVH